MAGGGRILWTFSLLVAATMIAALGAEEAGSKDNEDSVILVQKRVLRGVLFVATNQSRISCSREHLNGLSSQEKMNSLQVSIWS